MFREQEKGRKAVRGGNVGHFRTQHGIEPGVNSVPYKLGNFGHVNELVICRM